MAEAATSDLVEVADCDEKHQERPHVANLIHAFHEVDADHLDEEADVDAHIAGIVPETDDPSTPCATFRTYFLGTVFGVGLGCMNAMFSFKSNPVTINAAMVTIITYPLGHLMARLLPSWKLRIIRFEWTLNPGPFTLKEHVLVTLVASAISSVPYGIDNAITQKWVWGIDGVNYWNSICWVLCTQLCGFGLAGVMRRFLIWPKEMMWPANLSQIAIFVSFHRADDEKEADAMLSSRFTMSRFKFFWIAAICMFVYEWLPNYFMVSLQTISLVCFFTSNYTARLLGSGNMGPGIGVFSLDWAQVYGSSFMQMPFWASCCILLGNILTWWVITPLAFYSNFLGADDTLLPSSNVDTSSGYIFPAFNEPTLFSEDGRPFVARDILDSDLDLNETAYMEHAGGRARLTTFFALNYGQSFFSLAAVVSHCFLWYGPKIMKKTTEMVKGVGHSGKDIHNEIMRNYPEVPEWVYAGILLFFTVAMCFVGAFTPFTMPIWAVFLCVSLSAFFTLPTGLIVSVTGQMVHLNVLTEFIIGLIIPGETVTVMAFKSLGVNVQNQALVLLSDLKLGHYLHIPPRHMLITQLYGTVVGALIQTYVCISMVESKGWLSILGNPAEGWSANTYKVFSNAGAIWGAIGPARFFGGPYTVLYYAFIIGFALPFFPWIANKIRPSKWWYYINIPMLSLPFNSPGFPQNFFLTSFVIAFIFQYYAFRHHYDWYAKYNYVLASAFDAGMAVAITLGSQLVDVLPAPKWAGNPGTFSDYYCTEWGAWARSAGK